MTNQEIQEMLLRKLDLTQTLIMDNPKDDFFLGYKQALLHILKLITQGKEVKE